MLGVGGDSGESFGFPTAAAGATDIDAQLKPFRDTFASFFDTVRARAAQLPGMKQTHQRFASLITCDSRERCRQRSASTSRRQVKHAFMTVSLQQDHRSTQKTHIAD